MNKLKEIIDGFFNGYEVIDELSFEIWNYIHTKHKEFLDFYGPSSIEDWEIDEDGLKINYWYSSNGYPEEFIYTLSIPLEILYKNTWKEFVNEYFNRKKTEHDALRIARESKEKAKRRQIFETLKKEFENE